MVRNHYIAYQPLLLEIVEILQLVYVLAAQLLPYALLDVLSTVVEGLVDDGVSCKSLCPLQKSAGKQCIVSQINKGSTSRTVSRTMH